MVLWLRLCRLFFALLCIAAVAALADFAVGTKQVPMAHYFSFFTIQSNLLAAVLLIIGAVRPTWSVSPAGLLCRGAVVLYLLITGVIYALLLSELPEVKEMMLPWADRVLHEVIPLVVLADWLIARPQSVLTFRQTLGWLLYPFVYMSYSLVRGALVHWYPYPFLNPEQPGGRWALAGYCAAISLLAAGLSWGIVRAARWRYPNPGGSQR